MDVDPSLSRMLKPSQAPAYQNRKPAESDRSGPHKKQRVHHVAQRVGDAEETYTTASCSAAQEINDDAICEYDSDVVNFLGENPVIRRRVAGIDMKLLIDTGASKNFIRPYEGLKGVRPVESPFRIHLESILFMAPPLLQRNALYKFLT